MLGTNKHNFKIVIKENIIYFVTVIVCIALFYGFVSLGDVQNPLVQGNTEYNFEAYAPMIRYCIYAVSVSIFILISYVNTHIFREKLKEISILITLGMQRGKIAVWYSRDMLLLSALSFIIGILAGIGCSYVVNAAISLLTYGKIISNKFFYFYSFAETLGFFLIMYGGMTIINIIKVMYKKPLELLNNSKIPDSKRITFFRKIIELFFLIGSYSYIGYNLKVYFSIGRNYSGNIPDYESNKFQFAIFVAIIIAIFFTIKIVNYLLMWIKKMKIIKYGMQIFIIGKLSHRMRSITRNMLLITIVLTLSLCGFSLIPLMAEFSKEYMEHRMVFEVNIPFNYNNIEEMNDIPNVNYDFVKEILLENDIEIENECELEEYFIWDSDFSGPSTRKNKYDMPRLAVGISDYNQLRIMAGLDPINLGQDCFVFHVKDDIDLTQFEEALSSGEHLINVSDIWLHENSDNFFLTENLGSYIYNFNTDSFLVFPDEVCEKLNIAKKGYFANTAVKIPYAICQKVDENIQSEFRLRYRYLYDKYGNNGNQGIDFIGPIRFRSIEENDISFMVIITKALGMYIGIIFMLICMAMVSIKNIIECNNSVKDYIILQQIGMSERQLKQINFKENFFFYLLPYVVSIVNFCIIQNTFIMRFGSRANTYFQGNQYLNGIFIPIIIVSIILLMYVGTVQIINFNRIRNSLESGQ